MAAIPFQPMMESRPIREIAYEVLKHAIITGEIPAGERIVETEYADRLHISRTPLREALRTFSGECTVIAVLRQNVRIGGLSFQIGNRLSFLLIALEIRIFLSLGGKFLAV